MPKQDMETTVTATAASSSNNNSQFATRRSQLREKIRALETERTALEREIATLKEKVDVVELERYSTSLDNEVGTLKIEKAILEEKVANASFFQPQQQEDMGGGAEAAAAE
jgi:membrane-bound lytic murein transglycosylase B